MLLTLLLWTGPAGLTVGCGGASPEPPPEPALVLSERPRNVLVLSLDTLRPELLGRYTGADDTPRLDALLDGGVVLEDHQSCSNWTFSAMICAQAAARPEDVGFVPRREDADFEPLPGDVLLVSEVLRSRGFQTALVTTNSNFSADVGLVRGFDAVQSLPGADATWVTTEALAAADRLDPDRPWYLHAHYLDPHTPYTPPEELLGPLDGEIDFDLDDRDAYEAVGAQWDNLSDDMQARVMQHMTERYLGEYRHMDAQIGALLDGLGERGLLDDTLVVIYSDHGEQFMEHGHFGHGQSLYSEELDALAAFSAPGLTPGVWAGPTRIEDVWPTALEAIGQDAPEAFDGVVAGLRDPGAQRRAFRVHAGSVSQSVEADGLKLMYWWTGRWELYRVSLDPDEQTPLTDPLAPGLSALWDAVREDAEALDRLIPDQSPVFDDEAYLR